MAENIISVNVALVNGVPMVSSLDVAEKFEKSHKHVLDAIRKLIEELPVEFSGPNFRPVEYTDAKGEKRPMYHLTRDAFSLLAMGFTGKKALAWKVKYIAAFNAMEAELLKRSASKQKINRQQASLPAKDKYVAYIEEVEAFRSRCSAEIDRLLDKGLDLIDFRLFGTNGIAGFTPILIDWLQGVAGQHVPLVSDWHSMERAIQYSPLCLMKRMETFLSNRFVRP